MLELEEALAEWAECRAEMAEVNEWMKGVEQRQAADSLEQQLQLQEVSAAIELGVAAVSALWLL